MNDPDVALEIKGAASSGIKLTNASNAARCEIHPSGSDHCQFMLRNSSDAATVFLMLATILILLVEALVLGLLVNPMKICI